MRTDTLTTVGRPKKDEPTGQLRLPRSTLRRIRRLASHFGKDPGDYATDLLGPLLDKAESRMLADIERERSERADA
jgi:hypothetical protein